MALPRSDTTLEMAIPCQRCGAASGHECWDSPVCGLCASDWFARAPTAGEVAKTYGRDNTAKGWREFTAKWLLELKRGAA